MAIATLQAIIDRPITDRSNWTDRIRSRPTVKNWWSTVQGMSYIDPVTGYPRIRPRIGTAELVSVPPASSPPAFAWANEGGYPAASFAGDDDQPDLQFTRAALTGIWSFVHIRRTNSGRPFGIELTADRVSTLQDNAVRNASDASMQFNTAGGDVDDRVSYSATPAVAQRSYAFQAVDFTNGTIRGAVNSVTPGSARSWPNWGTYRPNFSPNWTFKLGEARVNRPANVNYLDFAIVQGDIFTLPNVLADFQEYATTVYQG